MATVKESVWYNKQPRRIVFPSGKMGTEINGKSDAEFSIIKSSYESLHPDAAIMSFEDHVRLADEAYNRRHPGRDQAPSSARPAQSIPGASETVVRDFAEPSHRNSTQSRGLTAGASRREESQQHGPSRSSSQRSKPRESNVNASESSSRLLEKLGLDKPDESTSSESKKSVPSKSNLFHISGDTAGYGLGTNMEPSAKASKMASKTSAKHGAGSRLSQIPEESASHASSSRNATRPATAKAPRGLPRISEDSVGHGSSSRSYMDSQASEQFSRGSFGDSSRASHAYDASSRYGSTSRSHYDPSASSRYQSTSSSHYDPGASHKDPRRGHSTSSYSNMSSGRINSYRDV